jgi:predicted aspartyl protease
MAVTVVTTVGTGGLGASATTDSTQLQSSKPGEVVVPVMLNGQGPFAFILDTGSSHSFIAETAASKLGAPAVAKSLIRSSIGLAMRAIVRLDSVELGPSITTDVFASLVPDETLDPTGRITGVIGQDVLAGRCYTIDFANRRVIWHAQDGAPHADGTSVALQSVAGRFLVELLQRNASTLRLIPDSGAEGLVLYQRDDRRLPALMLAPGRTRMSTLTSDADVQPIRVGELRVGSTNFVNLPGVLIDRRGEPAVDVDGLLPLHLFARVTFDGPGRRLIVH